MLIDRERQEAIDAGERALDSLYGVRKELESAGNWGLLDMFGGGMFTTFVKHSKMNDAQRYMVSIDAFASNVMPVVRVTVRGEAGL